MGSMMKRVVLISFMAIAALGAFAGRPNILLIYVDDLGYGDLGCYGGTDIPTPNLDRLAAEGVRFSNGYVTSAVCGPSRAGLLTGAYQNRFGIGWNPDVKDHPLPETQVLLPKALGDAGYATAVIGKWNLNADIRKSVQETHDIMFWAGDYWPNDKGEYFGIDGWADSKVQGIWGPVREGDEYLTDRLSRKACDFIEHDREQPFFLYLAYNAPHSPLHGKKEHLPKLSHLPNEALQLYASMVMAIDEGIGRIGETLDKQGLAKDTLVIFISDNGPTKSGFKNYKEEWPEQLIGSVGPLSGRKGTFYEGGIRVPFIMKWPGKLEAGTVSDAVISALDLYPTLCTLAGVHPPESNFVDGLDVSGSFASNLTRLPERSLFWSDGEMGAVRKGAWKLRITPGQAAMLYNLETDVAEQQDLADEQPEVVDTLLASYRDWMSQMPEIPRN